MILLCVEKRVALHCNAREYARRGGVKRHPPLLSRNTTHKAQAAQGYEHTVNNKAADEHLTLTALLSLHSVTNFKFDSTHT